LNLPAPILLPGLPIGQSVEQWFGRVGSRGLLNLKRHANPILHSNRDTDFRTGGEVVHGNNKAWAYGGIVARAEPVSTYTAAQIRYRILYRQSLRQCGGLIHPIAAGHASVAVD
jgi:hypothetical protein